MICLVQGAPRSAVASTTCPHYAAILKENGIISDQPASSSQASIYKNHEIFFIIFIYTFKKCIIAGQGSRGDIGCYRDF